jgi:hypothetical protein
LRLKDGYVPVILEYPNVALPDQSFGVFSVLARAHVDKVNPAIITKLVISGM